jgi:hypothetical protein
MPNVTGNNIAEKEINQYMTYIISSVISDWSVSLLERRQKVAHNFTQCCEFELTTRAVWLD